MTVFKDQDWLLMAAAINYGYKEENIPMFPVVVVLHWANTKLVIHTTEHLDLPTNFTV